MYSDKNIVFLPGFSINYFSRYFESTYFRKPSRMKRILANLKSCFYNNIIIKTEQKYFRYHKKNYK
ncbi:MAG: hypothetical protein B6D45_05970 [Ignavibacteriales bacterium UTCHB3]|nr:MAG: hypothetical protein B6D45_05970 [Ignavibacteriales bacterium UTCHB3]